jgi:hypothetical protein
MTKGIANKDVRFRSGVANLFGGRAKKLTKKILRAFFHKNLDHNHQT